mgnify:CR=1 FL=1
MSNRSIKQVVHGKKIQQEVSPGTSPKYRDKDRFGRPFSDMSDRIGSQRPTATAKGHVIHFHSIATDATVHFKAFLTDFKEFRVILY